MNEVIYEATISGCPRTKNSPNIRKTKDGRCYVAPSDAFLSCQDKAGWELNIPDEPLDG